MRDETRHNNGLSRNCLGTLRYSKNLFYVLAVNIFVGVSGAAGISLWTRLTIAPKIINRSIVVKLGCATRRTHLGILFPRCVLRKDKREARNGVRNSRASQGGLRGDVRDGRRDGVPERLRTKGSRGGRAALLARTVSYVVGRRGNGDQL